MGAAESSKGHAFSRLSYETIGACIEVQRQLGVHCMEIDYQRALEIALPKRGLSFEREVEIPIAFDDVVVTRRRVDFVIWDGEDELILETKARSAILDEDVEQCPLYLHRAGTGCACWSTLARSRSGYGASCTPRSDDGSPPPRGPTPGPSHAGNMPMNRPRAGRALRL